MSDDIQTTEAVLSSRTRSNKRRRLLCAGRHEVNDAATSCFTLLPDEMITARVFDFLGAGHYRYVGGVNRQFRDLYKGVLRRKFEGEGREDAGEAFYPVLSFASIVGSISCAKIWLTETHGGDPIKPLGDYYENTSVISDAAGEYFDEGQEYVNAVDLIALQHAAISGNLQVLIWARESGCNWYKHICLVHASRNGNLDMLKWAHRKGYSWDEETCAKAADGGHLNVLKWARQNGCDWWDETTCSNAAYSGHLEVLVKSGRERMVAIGTRQHVQTLHTAGTLLMS